MSCPPARPPTHPPARPLAPASRRAVSGNLRKLYRPLYVWGQLSGWFKQTVNDPTASLSAERRGTVSLPDVESCFAGKTRYSAKVGALLLLLLLPAA